MPWPRTAGSRISLTPQAPATPSPRSSMERLLERAASVLFRLPTPALNLCEVEEVLRREEPSIRVGGAALLRWLQLRPDLFTIIDPWEAITQGRVLDRPELSRGGRPAGGRALSSDPEGPWIVALVDPSPVSPMGSHTTAPLERVRAAVVWASRSVDRESPRALARWLSMVYEARELLTPEWMDAA